MAVKGYDTKVIHKVIALRKRDGMISPGRKPCRNCIRRHRVCEGIRASEI